MTRALVGWVGGVTGRLGFRVQLVLLLLLFQMGAHVLTFVVFWMSANLEGRRTMAAVDLADSLLSVLSVMSPSDLAQGSPGLDRLLRDDPRFTVLLAPPAEVTERLDPLETMMRAAATADWRDNLRVYALDDSVDWPGPPMQPFGVILRLSEATWLNFIPNPGILARTAPYLLGAMSVAVISLPLAFLAVWAGVAVSAPMERLARGVDAFSRDIKAMPIEEDGPLEVRRATAAVNRMQSRLRALIDDRAKTLSAIGHDMRTPLTRLRLRLESVDAGEAKEGLDSDLSTLERMIEDALRFMRAEGQQVHLAPTDMAILCRTMCDDWADQGHPVSCDVSGPAVTLCDVNLMARVLNNLIGNAIAYAGDATVSLLRRDDKRFEITVADTGPGIPEALRATVLKPFSRLTSVEAGGAGSTEGFGLGLAIAQELMARQGGSLRLDTNVPQGLRVVLDLPVRAAEKA